jgi:hypothetical protein
MKARSHSLARFVSHLLELPAQRRESAATVARAASVVVNGLLGIEIAPLMNSGLALPYSRVLSGSPAATRSDLIDKYISQVLRS